MQKRRRKRRRNRSKRSLGYTEDAAEGTQRTGTASLVLHFHVDYSPFDTLKFLTAAETSSSVTVYTAEIPAGGICPVYFSTHTRSTAAAAAAAAQFTNHVAS